MDIKCGADLVEIARVEKILAKSPLAFLNKFMTEAEQAYCRMRSPQVAGRFAAKEAVAKALGSGFWQDAVSLKDIEILPDSLGAPQLYLYGAAQELYTKLGGLSISISISHDGAYALAYCNFLCQRNEK